MLLRRTPFSAGVSACSCAGNTWVNARSAGYSVRVVTVVVQAEQADDLFEYIFYQVNFDHPCPGLIYQGDLLAATPYTLPAGVQEEKGE